MFMRCAAGVCLAFFVSTPAVAQTFGVTGRVVDSQGGVVVHALVTLTGAAGGRPLTGRSSAEGTFFPVEIRHQRVHC